MRQLERGILVVGGLFVACALGISAYEEWLLGFLPDDPERYLALRRGSLDGVRAAMLPLGFLLLLSCLADASRADSLRSRRALLRGATIAGLVTLAWLGGVVRGDPAVTAGPDLLAAARAHETTRWLMRGIVATLGGLLWAAHRAPLPPPAVPDRDGRYPSPWIPPLFGTTPALPARQWRVLGLMVAAGLFNAYDQQILSLALKQVQEGLGIAEGQVGYLGSLIRFGGVPGIALVPR